jgi:ribosomal protein S8
MQQSFKHLINLVNQQVQQKKLTIVVPHTKIYFSFIRFLYKENYLEFFYLQKNFIFFKIRCFAGQPALRKVVSAQKKSQKKYMKLPVLHKSGTKNFGSMVFSTNVGTLTQKQAAKIRMGGLFSCFLF